MITLMMNGSPRTLDEPMPLLEFLSGRKIDPRLVVVELNGTILRREEFGEAMLREGDQVEIVHMMAGG